MIDFTGKTYFSILKAMLDQIPNTYDKRDTSPIPTALGPAAYALEGFYLSLDKVQKEAFVQTAVGQSLDYLAAIAGLSRYQASKAVRLAPIWPSPWAPGFPPSMEQIPSTLP